MAAPPNSNDFVGQNFRTNPPMNRLTSSIPGASGSGIASGFPQVQSIKRVPPPLPSRNSRRVGIYPNTGLARPSVYPTVGNYSYPGYNQFSQYGGMGFTNNYSSYSGYNRFNNYGYNGAFGGYPANNMDSRLIQLAEERARPLFQSVESVLQTFSAISLMLDSTFMAMHTSFRAVLGVAENFAKLRTFLRQFLSAIATLKIIRWFYRHILYFLGIVSRRANKEDLWREALVKTGSEIPESISQQSKMSMPVLMFMGLVLCGPYLIFKLLNSIYPSEIEPAQTWNPATDPYQTVQTLYGFQAQTEGEITFQPGQILRMAPLTAADQSSGWVLVADQHNRIGYAPLNRLHLGAIVSHNSQIQAKPTPKAPDLVKPADDANEKSEEPK